MKEAPGKPRQKSYIEIALYVILAIFVVRVWVMPLGSSFWVDEMGTVFVVTQGSDHPSFAAAPQVPASIYYWLPRVSSALFGQSEMAYRFFSVVAIALAVWLIARLGARLVHPDAAWFAAFACLSLTPFNFQAADARPYGFGTLVSAAGVLFLVKWLDSAHWRDAAVFAVCAALLWRVHLIFWPFYFVFAAYVLFRLLRRDTEVTWLRAALVFGAAGVALLPVLIEALKLFKEAGDHVIVKPPNFNAFQHELRWNLPGICLAAGAVLARWRGWKIDYKPLNPGSKVLMLAWWLATPLGLYAFSLITGNSVFVARYLSLMLPGLALCATAAAGYCIPPSQWKTVAAVLGLGALIYMGQWGRLWPYHSISNWRGAAAAVNQLALGPQTPVICPSPFIEARPPNWTPAYRLPGFLYSYLPVYPVRAKVELFPFDLADGELYATQLLHDELLGERRFLIFGGGGAVRDWREWFRYRPELIGWGIKRYEFGDVEVTEFDAPGLVESFRSPLDREGEIDDRDPGSR